MNAENNFTFRQAAGGWIFAQWDDQRKEWSDEEIFTDGMGLIHRICDIVADCEPTQSVEDTFNNRSQFLKDNAGRGGAKPPER